MLGSPFLLNRKFVRILKNTMIVCGNRYLEPTTVVLKSSIHTQVFRLLFPDSRILLRISFLIHGAKISSATHCSSNVAVQAERLHTAIASLPQFKYDVWFIF